MAGTRKKKTKAPTLRSKAEKRLKAQHVRADKLKSYDLKRLVHELQVHQVELGMQNDELRHSQSVAQDMSRRYGDLFDFAPVALFMLTRVGIILECNVAAADLLKVRRARLLKRSILEHLPIEQHDAFLHRLQRVPKDGEKLSFEIAAGAVNDQPKRLEFQCVSDGQHIRAVVIDITERRKYLDERERLLAEARRAQADAEKSSRAKDEFLALISHELRTPLTAMRGWTSILRRHKLDREAEVKGLNTIERNIVAQDRLIEDLLDVSRITSGKLKIEKVEVELSAIVNEVVESFRDPAAAKKITLELHSAAEPQFVRGDEVRLKQVISNLLSNSVKFTLEGGRISISLRRAGDEGILIVSDNGIGIAPQTLPHIFERFHQEESLTSRQTKGLGLGLNIVKHLVEAHEGNIEAHSEGRGQGATFIVRLPLQTAQLAMPHPPEAQQPAAPETLSGINILVVEDDEDTRDYLHRLLTAASANVVVAESVDEALHKMLEFTPDLVLTDIGMPRKDGYQLMRAVHQLSDSEHPGLPVIAISAFTRDSDADQVAEAGFATFLRKPFEPQHLLSAIGKVLDVTNHK